MSVLQNNTNLQHLAKKQENLMLKREKYNRFFEGTGQEKVESEVAVNEANTVDAIKVKIER